MGKMGNYTWRSARRRAKDRALEREDRPSGARGKVWKIGRESLRDLNSMLEELLDCTFFVLSVSSLKAPTSSTTILPLIYSTNVVAVATSALTNHPPTTAAATLSTTKTSHFWINPREYVGTSVMIW